MDINDLAYYYYDLDHDCISNPILDFIYDHLTLILSISFLLYFISLAIIIINGSHLKTKNSDNTCDTDNGTNTDDTNKDNNEDEKYITDNNENEKHIMGNMNKHMANIDTTLCLFLILFVFLIIFTR